MQLMFRQFFLQPVTWGSLALLLATGLGLIYYYDTEKRRRIDGENSTFTFCKSLRMTAERICQWCEASAIVSKI